LQISENIQQLPIQLARLKAFERGVVIKLTTGDILNNQIIQTVINDDNNDDNYLFIFDFGGITKKDGSLVNDLNTMINNETALFNQIAQGLTNYRIALSSTSFPHDFKNVNFQDIFERQLYQRALDTDDNSWHLLYSDKASVRVAIPQGGGGIPYPRIDYPTSDLWYFQRAENNYGEVKAENYHLMALNTIRSNYWNNEMNIWGTQLIRETAANNTSGNMFIQSPAKATAARINIHLHQQLFYNNRQAILETDDDWTD
jgi:hypothetical protein